ncbi:MAG: cation diffusion facilitator family transporter [Candidatus Gastranaerophilaceae bacterium]
MQLDKANNEKKLATIISVISNSSLIAIKIIAGIITGSMSIISEAIHSLSDLLASFIAYFSVSLSSQPADEEHTFGHGKYEDLSGLLEGLLIIFAALYISYEAVKKIIFDEIINLQVDTGIYVMFLSAIINLFVSLYLFKVAKKTSSLAIYADAEHLRTDIVSSIGVCLGLIIIKITNIPQLDAIIALIVAVIIFIAGLKICNKAKNNLVDMSLDNQDIKNIERIINEYLDDKKLISIKHLRTRKSGIKKNIEIVIIADRNMKIVDGHALCDKIEQSLEQGIGNTDVTIHLEPN